MQKFGPCQYLFSKCHHISIAFFVTHQENILTFSGHFEVHIKLLYAGLPPPYMMVLYEDRKLYWPHAVHHVLVLSCNIPKKYLDI